MRERITFVHEPQDGIDPKSIGIHTNTLSFSGLKASREDHITLSLEELPQELRSALSATQELHVRYVTPSSYKSIPPFNSQLSPGLHVHYTPKRNARKDGKETDCHNYLVDSTSRDDLLCPIINKVFNVQDKSLCSAPEVVSFTSLPSQSPKCGYEYYLRENEISPAGGASAILDYVKGICKSSTCQKRVEEGADAAYIDFDFDAVSETAIITTLWESRTWDTVISKTDHEDRVELGILSNEKPIQLEELNMSGFLTVLGESKKPSPTMFQFVSRHHKHAAKFSASFVEPTGMHPTLKLDIGNSNPPKGHAGCSLNAHLTLPRSIFPDKYQLRDPLFMASKNLTALRHVTVPVDLEAPEYKMTLWGSSLLLELAPPPSSSKPWSAEVPLHLRYLLPTESGYSSTSLPSPVLFWTCPVEDEEVKLSINPFDRVNLGYDGLFDSNTLFYHLSPEPTKDLYNSVKAPVLNSGYNEQIEVGTSIVIFLGFGWVLWKLWFVWVNHGYGRNDPPKVSAKEE